MMANMSHVVAADPAVDLAVAEAMTDELEKYLVANDLYRTLIVHTPSGDLNLQMTGGDLLTRLHRLRGQKDQLPHLRPRIEEVAKKADAAIYSLRSRFVQRLQREVKARLDSLRWFLDECDQDRKRCRADFPYEIRNRQRIQEILKFTGDALPQDLATVLAQVDHRIRRSTVGSPFIWDSSVQNVFPPAPYWFLYVMPV
jgi:hypothetical protein